MELPPYIALGVLTLVLAVANYLLPSRRKRINRALASKPRALVRDAHGSVRLIGRIRRSGDLLRAPLSGRPCIAYEVLVDEPGLVSKRGGAEWRRMVELREAQSFFVADESGEARIDTSGPFLMSVDYDRSGKTEGKYPGKHQDLASFLTSIDVVSTDWLGEWISFRYAEGVLEDGELVTVSADSVLEVDSGGERAGPRSPPQRLVLRGTEALPLLISDAREARGSTRDVRGSDPDPDNHD
jgi:hypothetical protein